MAQISAADVTEIVKLGKDTVAAGYNQIQATFTGHQTLAFQGGDKTAIIPGSWQEYNVPLQVVQNLSLETAMVSYANVVTHRQKRALMGVEKGQSKSGGVLDPTKAEALADSA